MACSGNALGDDKVRRQMLVTGVEKMTKIENMKNNILEPLASSPALSATSGDVFGAPRRKIYSCIAEMLHAMLEVIPAQVNFPAGRLPE